MPRSGIPNQSTATAETIIRLTSPIIATGIVFTATLTSGTNIVIFLPLPVILEEVYHTSPGLANGMIPNDPELPLPLNKVHPIHEVVKVDYFMPGCPPSGDAIWKVLTDLLAGREPELGRQRERDDVAIGLPHPGQAFRHQPEQCETRHQRRGPKKEVHPIPPPFIRRPWKLHYHLLTL